MVVIVMCVCVQLTVSSGSSLACLSRSKHRLVTTDRMWLVGSGHTCWSVNGTNWTVLPSALLEPAAESFTRHDSATLVRVCLPLLPALLMLLMLLWWRCMTDPCIALAVAGTLLQLCCGGRRCRW